MLGVDSNLGMIPRAITAIFNNMTQAETTLEFTVKVSSSSSRRRRRRSRSSSDGSSSKGGGVRCLHKGRINFRR